MRGHHAGQVRRGAGANDEHPHTFAGRLLHEPHDACGERWADATVISHVTPSSVSTSPAALMIGASESEPIRIRTWDTDSSSLRGLVHRAAARAGSLMNFCLLLTSSTVRASRSPPCVQYPVETASRRSESPQPRGRPSPSRRRRSHHGQRRSTRVRRPSGFVRSADDVPAWKTRAFGSAAARSSPAIGWPDSALAG